METQRNEGSIHPSIRRFKQEAAPQSIRNSDPESGESQPVGNETNNVEIVLNSKEGNILDISFNEYRLSKNYRNLL